MQRGNIRDNHSLVTLLPWLAGAALIASLIDIKRASTSPPLSTKYESPNGTNIHGRLTSQLGKPSNPLKLLVGRWRDVCSAVYREFNDDRLMAVAGGVVFYGILSLFPAISAFVALYGLFTDPHIVKEHLSLLQPVVPASAFQVIQTQVERTIEGSRTQLGLTSLFSLAVTLWSANTGTKAAMDALNVVYDKHETRSFLRLNSLSLALTLGAMAILMIAVGMVVVLPVLFAFSDLGKYSETLAALLRWPLLILLVLSGLFAFYRFGVDRSFSGWRWLSIGAIVALVGWMAASFLLSWYLANFGNYNAIYGSLGAVMGLMMWMWLSTVIVLAGAELNAVLERAAQGTALEK